MLLISYGFALLEHVIDGRSQPLVLSMDMRSAYAIPAVGTFVLVCAVYDVTGGLRRWLDPYLIDALRLGFIALLPAMLGIMAMTGRFTDALNPAAVVHTIRRIPAAYLALVIVLAALWVVPVSLAHASQFDLDAVWRPESLFPLGLLPVIGARGALLGLLGHIVVAYLWLATFACIGGALYEHRVELDFEPAESPERRSERDQAELERARDLVMDRLFWEWRGGAYGTADASVRALLAQGRAAC